MSHPANPDLPTVLLVAEDRPLLRRLSRFLNTFGYRVQQVAEMHRAAALLDIEPPALMIVDAGKSGRRALDFCRNISAPERTAGIHLLLLIDHQAGFDVTAALEAGVDDFLAKPLVYGELLARLRAGLRVWEFERRARRQHLHDPVTGLPGPAVLSQRLRAYASQPGAAAACVVLGLDFFRSVTETHGRLAGHEILRNVAQLLRNGCDETMVLTALGGDQFGCLLPGAKARDAVDWAENVRRVLAETEFSWQGTALSLSASFGVAAGDASSGSLEGVIARAGEALRRAKQSGRNCVVRCGEFQEEDRAWSELAAPGKLFERTVARDVMIPFPLLLHRNEPVAMATMLLQKTRLEVLAIVDEAGCYQGAVTPETLLHRPAPESDDSLEVGQVASRDLTTFDLNTPFATLLDYFAREGDPLAIVVDHNRPMGFISAASLAGLTCPPDCPPSDEPRFGSDYLLVPESCATACP